MSNTNQESDAAGQPPFGIDLGTTYSVVAYIDSTGRPTTVPNRVGDNITPSAILFDEDGIVIGREAAKSAAVAPEAFADCFKRDMGTPAYHNRISDVDVPPEVLSALILERLKEDAERRIGPIKKAVITVPAFFDETRRKATQDAGRLAGLEVLDIINEPTAAAVAFGYQHGFFNLASDTLGSKPLRVLVYDLGGGTFDVTILEIDGTRFRALATDGDVRLGGKDFDERIVDHLAERFLETHGLDPRSDVRDASQLWLDAQEAKHALSERTKTTVVCFHAGLRMRIELTRDEFEEMTADLAERTATTTSLVLKQANLDWSGIDRLILVGGSTRMPMVTEMLRKVSGQEPDLSASPDEAVAHGAALYAGMLMGNVCSSPLTQFELTNVNSHSLGVVGLNLDTGRKVNVILVPKNTPLPCHVARTFPIAKAGQRDVKIEVIEGESTRPSECISIGHCNIRDLPPGLPSGTQVVVEYEYSSNGRISVSARLPSTRNSARVEIKREYGQNLADLATWKARLLGLESSLTPGGVTDGIETFDSSDPAVMRKRIDALYMKIGKQAVTQDLPESLVASQQAVKDAASELKAARDRLAEVEDQVQHAAGRSESIQAKARLAAAKSDVEQLQTRAEFSLLVLGRSCVEQEYEPSGCEVDVNKVLDLKSRLTS